MAIPMDLSIQTHQILSLLSAVGISRTEVDREYRKGVDAVGHYATPVNIFMVAVENLLMDKINPPEKSQD